MDWCLKHAGAKLKDLDQVVFAWNPGHELEPQDSSAAVRYHKHFLHYVPNQLLGHISGPKENKRIKYIGQTLEFLDGRCGISFVPHHLAHAAAAFLVSPHHAAAVMTMDAYGDDLSHGFFHGQDNRLMELGYSPFPHSIGSVYAAITQYLGYRANSDEWKVMGMAAYGKPIYKDFFSSLIAFDQDRGQLKVNLDYFTYYLWNPRRYSDLLPQELGPERYADDGLDQRHLDIAASFQSAVEEVGLKMAAWLHGRCGENALCLAGGVHMNSRMNGRLLQESPFDEVWVQPSADDGGGCLGACYYYYNHVMHNPRGFQQKHDFWGPGFDNDEIEQVLRDALASYEVCGDPCAKAAEALARGKVIAWFQGRMEYGQRALGNRSILGDPRNPDMKDKINRSVKHREWYRPFAPAVLSEAQAGYFETSHPSEFMQMVLGVKQSALARIPAVVHADQTARVQTVIKEHNPLFWELINQFAKLTGVPVVLNTSFNDNGEPIVCTPREALRTFYSTGIEELYIGQFRLVKAHGKRGLKG
jgi:carbamoyltransferase